MACHLLGIIMWTYADLLTIRWSETNFSEILFKTHMSYFKEKYKWKCYLQNGSPLVPAPMCYCLVNQGNTSAILFYSPLYWIHILLHSVQYSAANHEIRVIYGPFIFIGHEYYNIAGRYSCDSQFLEGSLFLMRRNSGDNIRLERLKWIM